jgi:hypothetical protein
MRQSLQQITQIIHIRRTDKILRRAADAEPRNGLEGGSLRNAASDGGDHTSTSKEESSFLNHFARPDSDLAQEHSVIGTRKKKQKKL